MDRDEIDALVAQTLDAELHEVEERLALDAWRVNGPEWNQVAREVLSEKVDDLTEAIAENDLSGTLEDARRMAPSLSDGSQRILARRLLEVKLEACLAEMRALEGQPLQRAVIVPRKADDAPKKVTSPLLSELVRLYSESKIAGGKWTPKTKVLIEGRLLTMVDLIGDKPAHAVTTADMRALQVALPKVPAGYRMIYRGHNAVQAIERADAEKRGDRLSPKTLNLHVFDTKSVFKWAVKQELLTKSPADVLDEVKDNNAESRKPFTDEDLKAIFRTLKVEAKDNAARWWVPLILLYTGARLEEVCQLHAEDVRQEHGVWFFDINRDGSKRLKTDNSERLVPVHSRLVALGWLDYVKSVGRGHLFPTLPFREDEGYSAAFSKWAGRRLRRVGITDTRKVASHSFRHTMATRLGSAGVSTQIIDRLQGWADSSMRANYTHAPEAKALSEAIEKFDALI